MKTSCPVAEKKNRPCKNHKAKDTCGKRNPLCWFMLWTENKTMHVKWWTCPEPPDNCLEHSKAHHSDSHGSMDAASAEPIVCTVSSRSFTGTENATRGMAPSSDPKTSPTREPQIQEGLIAIIYLYAIPGLVVVTLFLLLCILVCLCRRKQKDAKGKAEPGLWGCGSWGASSVWAPWVKEAVGNPDHAGALKITALNVGVFWVVFVFVFLFLFFVFLGSPESKHAAEMNQLSTPPPAPQTEDLTYAKLIFERTGAIPAASEVVYTEIKPLQKK
ncbi:uncharacterized protein LOC122183313 isoform X3 [Lagopus leucura]|nr:uncharacterized protein LOC122183313 isoform X3 [Lagopus leucura]